MSEPVPPPSSRRHFNSLDGFRGLAFLLVFVRHFSLSSNGKSRLMHLAGTVGQGGWIGVDLFFTLSGFLITGILLDTVGRPAYFKNFFARRSLRIFPLYYGIFLLLCLLTPVLHLQWHPGHIAYLFYVGNIAALLHTSLTELKPDVSFLHLWSLALEEQFYLLWPWAIVFVSGNRQKLVKLCIGLSTFGLLLRIALLSSLDHSYAYEWCYSFLPTHWDGLLAGALGAVALRSWSIERILPLARRCGWFAFAALAAVYLTSGPNIYSPAMVLAGFPALAVLFTSILMQALSPGTLAFRFGSFRTLRFFGKYSYGMYVYHILFWPLAAKLLPIFQSYTRSIVVGGLLYVAAMLLMTCVMAVLSYHFYEKHWLNLKRYFPTHIR